MFAFGSELKASVPIDCDLVLISNQESYSSNDIYKLGYCKVKKEKYAEGIKLFKTVTEKLPILADYALYYQAFSYQQLNDNDKAVELYNELLGKHPNSTLKKRVSESLAEIYFQTSRIKSLPKPKSFI